MQAYVGFVELHIDYGFDRGRVYRLYYVVNVVLELLQVLDIRIKDRAVEDLRVELTVGVEVEEGAQQARM